MGLTIECVFELHLASKIIYCFVHIKEECFIICREIWSLFQFVLSLKQLMTIFKTLRNNKVIEVFSMAR